MSRPIPKTGADQRDDDRAFHKVSLDDKFDLSRQRVLLNGAQAVVRLALTQRARDDGEGLNTAGFVTGYRGSPIAGLEAQFTRAKRLVENANIRFQSGLNEDLAATALWGSQQAELRGEGAYDGVFGIWYGKGPGVDRSGDVFRHANHAGTSRNGGVLALMGDDHTCESSTSAHQSEFAFVDAMIPVLNPAGVQEILDYGIYGFALSRFAGCWVGMKCVKDNIESTATVDGRVDRLSIRVPEIALPDGGLNIRLGDAPLVKEERLHAYKRNAIVAFARANKLDQLVFQGGRAPRIGLVTSGKTYLDTRQALLELGIDGTRADELGIRLYKVALTWPLEPEGINEFAAGLDEIIVVEEKRSLIETQIKEQLYGRADAPVVIGKKDEFGKDLFPAFGALDPTHIALEIAKRLVAEGADVQIGENINRLRRIIGNRPATAEVATRIPYFCSGCPHNSSTIVPAGARAYAGIGCHYMVQWMDRSTEGFTHMGGEGANWIGEAPFSKRRHVFQNLGDGTYTHSGSLAVRACVAAGVNITYKILYNDAVAMTGGQSLDGGIGVGDIARQMLAEGVKEVVIVSDEPGKYGREDHIPGGVSIHHRDELAAVQQELCERDGVTILIYDQTCAAEKRRRRKRGLYPDPPKRAFINTDICEGCGDCGVQSNCVSIVPVETEFGRKRQIDQPTCNKDFSCLRGFCPSFVTVDGGRLRQPEKLSGDAGSPEKLNDLPEPSLPALTHPYSIVVTGVGGTGVVTISAVLGQAAHIEGKGFGAIDMAGLAQKGGAVACHTRFAQSPEDIHAIRAGLGGADLVLGCDLVVTASNKVLETVDKARTRMVVNSYEMITGDFTRNPDFALPARRLERALEERASAENIFRIDAHRAAEKLFGDTIAGNMFLLGFAYQLGQVPISAGSIEQAIELNGVAVEMNKRAFAYGRFAVTNRQEFDRLVGETGGEVRGQKRTLEEIVETRRKFLTEYQDAAYADKYVAFVRRVSGEEEARVGGRGELARAAAISYFKLLAYKDEYEVARLFTRPEFNESLAKQFEGDFKLSFHLAPPILARKDKISGRPRKIRFGGWIMPVFRLLAGMRHLRGGRLDPFRFNEERRLERRLIADYERLFDEILPRLDTDTHAIAVELAGLPQMIRGFGPVKLEGAAKAKQKQEELLAAFRKPEPASPVPGPAVEREAA